MGIWFTHAVCVCVCVVQGGQRLGTVDTTVDTTPLLWCLPAGLLGPKVTRKGQNTL